MTQGDQTADDAVGQTQAGWLGAVERIGNRLPDPVVIFAILIAVIMVVSAVAAALGWQVAHPVAVDEAGAPVMIEVQNLLSGANIARLLTEMPSTFAGFAPLGLVLVVMLGAAVAERSGLFASAMRVSVRHAPAALLTPVIAIVSMMSSMAADAAYVVLIPLAAVIYAAAGRHPLAGLAACFAGVAGGFSANIVPGQLDALLFGITEEAAEILAPSWDANIAGNWFFMSTLMAFYTPLIWVVTDRMIEPRLGPWTGGAVAGADAEADDPNAPLTPAQRRGLAAAGLALVGVVAAWVVLTIGPGTPLIDETARPEAQFGPFYRSLIAGFFVLFLACGWAYGAAAGTIKNHRDLVAMMTGGMQDMAYYLVLAFAAAHMVALFNWSNLGLLIAVSGAQGIESSGLPTPIVLGLMVVFAAIANLFIGSASAKWALFAPVMAPMLMLVGVSPEMATAAYRVGDSATNIITPLMPYFPLVLVFAQRWVPSFGLGSLTATMLPYSLWMFVVGMGLIVVWAVLGLPLGPGAGVAFDLEAFTRP